MANKLVKLQAYLQIAQDIDLSLTIWLIECSLERGYKCCYVLITVIHTWQIVNATPFIPCEGQCQCMFHSFEITIHVSILHIFIHQKNTNWK